jgi:hypothetical protein
MAKILSKVPMPMLAWLLGASLACSSGEPGADAGAAAAEVHGDDVEVMPKQDGSVDGLSPVPPTSACDRRGFSACGGDVLGVWRHREFCDLGGQPASHTVDCPSPWEEEQACRGAGNTNACRAVFQGTVEFRTGGEAWIDMTLITSSRFTLRTECVNRLRSEGTPAERCRALSTDALACQLVAAECQCIGSTLPVPFELMTFTYALEPTRLKFSTGSKDVSGDFCANGGQLAIQFDTPGGFEGWSAWSLERP